MSAADNIARTILAMGQIRAQGLQQAAEAQARAQANSAQVWGGALAGIGQTIAQVPQQIQQQKTAQIENQVRQAQLGQLQESMAAQQRANAVIAKLPKNPDGTFPTDQLIQQLAGANVPLAGQERFATTVDNLNKITTSFNGAKQQHLVKAAQLILDSSGDQSITPDSLHLTVAALKPTGLITDADEEAFVKAMAQPGLDPTAMLKGIIKSGTEPMKPTAIGAGGLLLPGGQVVPPQARPPEPGTGQHVINGQLVGPNGERIGQPVPPQKEPAAKALQRASVLVDGKPTEVLVDPDPTAAQKVFDLDGRPVANAAARIKPIPPASAASAASGATPAPIKPGSPEYQAAKDLASGKLTFPQFRTLVAYSRDAGKKLAIYQLASELNPEFNPSQFELGFKMASNASFRNRLVAINALNPVIDQVDALAQQVGNTDVPAFNKVLQSAKFNIGSRPVTNFRQMQILLGDEVGNALGVGTASDLKTRLGLDLVNPNLGPKQFADTMEQLRAVLGARKADILKQMGLYAPEQAAPATPPNPGVTPPAPQGQAGNPLGLQRPRR